MVCGVRHCADITFSCFNFVNMDYTLFVKVNLQIADQSCYKLIKKNHQTIEYSNKDIKKPVVHVKSTSEGYD